MQVVSWRTSLNRYKVGLKFVCSPHSFGFFQSLCFLSNWMSQFDVVWEGWHTNFCLQSLHHANTFLALIFSIKSQMPECFDQRRLLMICLPSSKHELRNRKTKTTCKLQDTLSWTDSIIDDKIVDRNWPGSNPCATAWYAWQSTFTMHISSTTLIQSRPEAWSPPL